MYEYMHQWLPSILKKQGDFHQHGVRGPMPQQRTHLSRAEQQRDIVVTAARRADGTRPLLQHLHPGLCLSVCESDTEKGAALSHAQRAKAGVSSASGFKWPDLLRS